MSFYPEDKHYYLVLKKKKKECWKLKKETILRKKDSYALYLFENKAQQPANGPSACARA